jgi:hypothetical protein
MAGAGNPGRGLAIPAHAGGWRVGRQDASGASSDPENGECANTEVRRSYNQSRIHAARICI